MASVFKENIKLKTDNCHFEIKNKKKFPAFRHLTEGHWAVSTRKTFGIRPACDINDAQLKSITVNPPYSVINLPSGCVGYTDDVMLSPFYEHAETSDSPSISKNKFNIQLDWPNDWNVLKNLNVTTNVDISSDKIKLPALPELGHLNLNDIRSKLTSLQYQSYVLKTSHNFSFYIIMTLIAFLVIILSVGAIMYSFKSLPCTKYAVMIRKRSMRVKSDVRTDTARSVHEVRPGGCIAKETARPDLPTTSASVPLEDIIMRF